MTAVLLSLALACGVEDWAQKTLTDGLAVVDATGNTVNALRGLPVDHSLEHEAIQLSVYIRAYKLESDEDLHVVVSDSPTGPTMIVELPAPHCASGSPYLEQMAKARADLLAILGPPLKGGALKRLKRPTRVRLTGVVYFDHLHGQTGVAPNGCEIHPVLSVERWSREAEGG